MHRGDMFSWGEDALRGSPAQDGVQHLTQGFHIRSLSASQRVLAFVKTNGNTFIIRTHAEHGKRVRGKQKFVKCKEQIEAVSCGDDVVTLLSDSGTVLCVDTAHPPFSPTPLAGLHNIQVSQVACGSRHSVALTKDGQVYTWGHDSRGQLGLENTKPGENPPQHLKSLSAVPLVNITAGCEQSFALSVSGGVFAWGRNDHGQLGLGDTTDRNKPTSVKSLSMKKIVHVSCGEDHTATLTKDGAVFTFGSGQYGQLGHNSFSDELHPRLVAELFGAKVTKIACGMHHTLVLTDTRKVYSFGCGDRGQLGHGGESHPSVPLPVQLPQGSGPIITNIFTGGNCSFATCTSNEGLDDESNTNSVSNVKKYCLDDLIDKWTSKCDSKLWKKIKQEIRRTFSSATCLNQSFLEKSKDKHFQTSTNYPGLSLRLAKLAFTKLVKKDDVLAEVEAALLHLLPAFDTTPVGVEGLRIFLLLNELLHVMKKHKPQRSTKLAEAVAGAMLRLSAESLMVIGNWWTSLSASTMCRYVTVWKKALSDILSLEPVPRNPTVKNLLLVLQNMYNANNRTTDSQRIPESKFHLSLDLKFLCDELNLWIQQTIHQKHTATYDLQCLPLILCDFPIVMDLQRKKLVFDRHAAYSQNNYYLSLQPPIFELNLRRESVLEDTIEQLHDAHHSDYKKPLQVYFDGNYTSSYVYLKDLFHDVFHDIMSLESGMFIFNDSKTLAWFPSRATQDPHRYFLIGVLCGLALYHSFLIHLPFPVALFKKLLGVKPSLEDMMEFCPCTGRSLQSTLEEYKDDDFKDLYMDFKICWDGTWVDLDLENPEKAVTSQNKKEFVDAYVNHAFNTSVEGVFEEFKKGFYKVCDRAMVELFRPKELQEVLVGNDFHDWEKLKQVTKYAMGYHADHPNIQMFWEVFDELTEDQKKNFLWFVTGFERVPVHGMENIKMTVQVMHVQEQDQSFPETLTCHSLLELPLYSTREIMQTKLTEALSNRRIYK